MHGFLMLLPYLLALDSIKFQQNPRQYGI